MTEPQTDQDRLDEHLDDLETGAWVILRGQPVTYLGTEDDGYVIYTKGHILIESTKVSMFTVTDSE